MTCGLLIYSGETTAHEVPHDVSVVVFVKAEADRVEMLVRVPLVAMRDIRFPVSSTGFVETSDAPLQDAAILWIADYIKIYENDHLLEAPRVAQVRVSGPTDRVFTSFGAARAHLVSRSPLKSVQTNQALLDIRFLYSIESENSRFSIEPALGHLGLRTRVLMSYDDLDERVHQFEFVAQSGDVVDRIYLDPNIVVVSAHFLKAGLQHILSRVDLLLFLILLVVPIRRLSHFVITISAFILAHSVTLVTSALQLVVQASWFSSFVEMLFAVSVLFIALETIVGSNIEKRWVLGLAFGLIHGFGFSYSFSESIQYSGSHPLTSLLAFNLGIEVGLLLFLLIVMLLGKGLLGGINWRLTERSQQLEKVLSIIVAALVAHMAWHWMLERALLLAEYQFSWPEADMLSLVEMLRWLILGLFVTLLVWAFRYVERRWSNEL